MSQPSADDAVAPLLLDIRRLTVRYRPLEESRRPAVQALSLSIYAGDALVVMGPNGSGKSTLLHTLMGSADAELDGEILLMDTALDRQPPHVRARHIALVHQDPTRGTAAHLTLREHCSLTTAASGRRAVRWDDLNERLERIGTKLDGNRPAGQLSGGQRQLFTVLVAVMSQPAILLLDEPTSALDTWHAAKVIEAVQDFSTDSRAVTIMVTHDPSEARRFGNRLLVMSAHGSALVQMGQEQKGQVAENDIAELLARASLTGA